MDFERENPLECTICNQILDQPILLPCGHTVCSTHETQAREQEGAEVVCGQCNQSSPIPENGFHKNMLAETLLRRKLQHMKLGPDHVHAVNTCKHFQEFLRKFRAVKQNPEGKISRVISELKNKIDMRREELKKRIDDEALELIGELDEFEKKCLADGSHLENIKNSAPLEEMLSKFENECRLWKSELSEFESKADRWRKIYAECTARIKKLDDNYENLKKYIFSGELYDYYIKQEKFCLDDHKCLL